MKPELEHLQAQVLDAVHAHGAEAVIASLAAACRAAAEAHKARNEWTHAGTYNHYGQTLEDLLPESDSNDSSRTNAHTMR